MNEQEKILQILSELKAAHSSSISALNHIHELEQYWKRKKKEVTVCPS